MGNRSSELKYQDNEFTPLPPTLEAIKTPIIEKIDLAIEQCEHIIHLYETIALLKPETELTKEQKRLYNHYLTTFVAPELGYQSLP